MKHTKMNLCLEIAYNMETLALVLYVYFFSWVLVEITLNADNSDYFGLDTLNPANYYEGENYVLYILWLPVVAVGSLYTWFTSND